MIESNLLQYIYNKKRQKVGIIQAFKIVRDELFKYYDSEVFNKPFVIIVHSKATDWLDKFDLEKGLKINYYRCYFVLNCINNNFGKRKKYIQQKPSREIKKYYEDMEKRARKYYKDCVDFYKFIDFFEYELEDEEYQSKSENKEETKLKKLLGNSKYSELIEMLKANW